MAFWIKGRAKVREVRKRKWVWTVAAVAVLLTVAVWVARRPHPVVADFQRLAIEHGLEPQDAERTEFTSTSLTPRYQERLKADFLALAARHGLTTWADTAQPVGPARDDWRGATLLADHEYMHFDLQLLRNMTTLDVYYERDSLGERFAQWFRDTFQRSPDNPF